MSTASSRTGSRGRLLLLGRFLVNPRTVGAIAPSSAALANRTVAALARDPHARVVELGPGTGAFTGALVERLGPDARILALDIEPAFVDTIRRQWPSVDCVCASAATLPTIAAERDFLPADHVISGLPFASLPGPLTLEILDGIQRTLKPGGTFTTFQYVYSYILPPAIAFRRAMTQRMGAPPTRELVLRNLPPAFVLRWRKQR